MNDVFINRDDSATLGVGQKDGCLRLLAQHQHMEIMKQTIHKNSFVWLTPGEHPDTMEFFFVLSGSLRLMLSAGPEVLREGCSFYVDGLTREIAIEALAETELLYVSNQPMFDVLFAYQADLQQLLHRIDEKDHITYRHSTNVVNYCIKVLERFPPEAATRDWLLPAAMFHDVGKCFLPDEILQKTGPLDASELRYIVKHPVYTGRLLKPCLGEQVASIAQNHHERMDGSGYPMGLSGDELSLEDRILAAVDSFEAMTSQRQYNAPVSFVAAAEELCGMQEYFDPRVTQILLELAKEGAFANGKDQTHE